MNRAESHGMDYIPPGYIQRTGDERFPRFIIRDGLGQYWAGEERRWRDKPSQAMLFHAEAAAVEERNRYCLGGDAADTFAVTMLVTVHARRWSEEDLARYLKRHRKFFLRGTAGKEGILLELVPDTLKRVEQ
jgi:hypothetical protein